ncbi:uncharacterized protein LOC143286662 [Babylonia areolata]|uniref:uncharacterized protein LOC143286662 n=1 Tax=Babylonia areolata TaxID=304850 RepID=UPI003FD1B006
MDGKSICGGLGFERHPTHLVESGDPAAPMRVTEFQTQRCAGQCSDCQEGLDKAALMSYDCLGTFVALDCEMYVTNHGLSLGRATMVDHTGYVLCDTFVSPKEEEHIMDHCTQYSSISEHHVKWYGQPYNVVQHFVANLLNITDKVLVVHDRVGDLKVLGLTHPDDQTRDTATALQLTGGSDPPGRNIQQGEHCSLVDARVTMAVYRAVHHDWQFGPEHHLGGGRGNNGGRGCNRGWPNVHGPEW